MPVKKFKPTPEQKKALDAIFKFIDGPVSCFILKGSAGTGKTSLISKIVEGFRKQERPFVILAPTGRAARVVGARTNNVAHTIHSKIYSLSHIEVFEEAESANDPGIRYFFPVKTDDPGETLFIVDEASMVGDKPSKQDVLRFGSGSLLTDLIEYLRLSRIGRPTKIDSKILDELFKIIQSRKDSNLDKSYTVDLLNSGIKKISQKVVEEAGETAIAAVSQDKKEFINESADLLYHLLVLWAQKGVTPENVWSELRRREGISGVLEKTSRQKD